MIDLTDFEKLPLVGILRGCAQNHLHHIVEAVRGGGFRYLEITMNTPGAEDMIRAAIELSGGSLCVGAGTVTSPALLDRALAAGAAFIVTPSLNREIIRLCVESKTSIFPGALTPTEIVAAWEAGATAVKVFPAEIGGPKYIGALRGPFPEIKLMPTGGVDLKTLTAFVNAGANAFGIGSPLFRKDRIDAEDWNWLEQQTQAFVRAYQDSAGAKA